MTLAELYKTVRSSNRVDWNVIDCWGGASSGPSYRNWFSQRQSKDSVWLEHQSHPMVGAYRGDVAISVAWGLNVAKYSEPWMDDFPDKDGSRHLIDLFYMGALVARHSYLSVDGARASLPIPELDGLTVPAAYSELVRLIDSLEARVTQYDDYFRRAGFRETNESWPGA
jgi:hypothetical protein